MNPSIKTSLESVYRLSQERGGPVYLVGGTVRDHLLMKPCMDYDFTSSNAPEIARAWAEKTKRTLVPLDETPGHETYRVVLKHDLYFDFTTLQGATIEADLSQRDFTVNALAVSLLDFVAEKPSIIDPFNGQSDLHHQIIRMVSEHALEEDPLRLLRAFRFASTLGFSIEPKTLKYIKIHRDKLNQVAKERITYELLILLGAEKSNLDLLNDSGLLEILFPYIKELKNKRGSQPGSTLWDNTRNVFMELEKLLLQPARFLGKQHQWIRDYLSKKNHGALLKWSAMISLTKTVLDPPFKIAEFLRDFRLSNSDIQFIDRTLKFTEIMLRGARSTDGGFKEDAAVYQFVHRSGNELISSLLLALAIRLGNQEDIKYFIPLINRILNFYIERYVPAKKESVLLDGDFLKNKLKLKPSPRFKLILDKVEEARVLGNIQTPEEAERLAKELITSQVELTE